MKAIKHWREKRGYTQVQLSQLLSITPEHLSYIENGHRKPSLGLLERMSVILNTDIGSLLKEEGTHNEQDRANGKTHIRA